MASGGLGRSFSTSLRRMFDGRVEIVNRETEPDNRVDWLRCIPFILLHLACFAVFWVGWSWAAILLALATYWFRVFALTGFYHRYFSHRSFRTSRAFQFLMAVAGLTAVQRGPLWWAAHHRHHHIESDNPSDLHSPRQHGFWMAHTGWFMTTAGFRTPHRYTRDWNRFRELLFLDRYDWIVPLLFAISLFCLGELLAAFAPSLGTDGWQVLVWAFFISTILLYQTTYAINSIAHVFGSKRFNTGDDSRNNWLLALITFGEGWHNNHHHYPASARQGFYWWEIDVTWYGLLLLRALGLIHDLRPVPDKILQRNRLDSLSSKSALPESAPARPA